MASNGKRMVREDLIKKLEEISLNPTYEILNFKNESRDIDFGYINENDPDIFGAALNGKYNTFTLKEHFSGPGYDPVDFYIHFPNAYELYPNIRGNFTVPLGAKMNDTIYYANNKGIIELPNSAAEKKLYLVTLYMANLDSGVSFLSDNDYGLCVVSTGWETDLYESGALYSDLTADEKTKIQNVLKNIKADPYDGKIGGMVQNMEGNSDIILTGTFAYHSDLVLNYLHNNNGTLSLTQEDINFLDANGVLLSQLTISEDMKFSIVQIL